MKTKNVLMYLLNKIDFDCYLEGNDDEKFDYITSILIDDFDDTTSVRVENSIIFLDGFVYFFDNNNNKLFGYW